MINIKNFFLFGAVIVFLSIIFYSSTRPSQSRSVIKEYIYAVEIGGQTVTVALASTPEQQAQGLSGRSSLKADEGMLFIFDTPGIHPFWMKDMKIPLDIIWLSEDGKIVYIKKDARPELFPESYAPSENAKYVLEVVSGFSEENNLKAGDRVEFRY